MGREGEEGEERGREVGRERREGEREGGREGRREKGRDRGREEGGRGEERAVGGKQRKEGKTKIKNSRTPQLIPNSQRVLCRLNLIEIHQQFLDHLVVRGRNLWHVGIHQLILQKTGQKYSISNL